MNRAQLSVLSALWLLMAPRLCWFVESCGACFLLQPWCLRFVIFEEGIYRA